MPQQFLHLTDVNNKQPKTRSLKAYWVVFGKTPCLMRFGFVSRHAGIARSGTMAYNISVKRDWLTAAFARFQPAPYLKRWLASSRSNI